MSSVPEEPSSDRKGGFLAFWTTLPGILTGLAALITAIVGAIGLWKTQSGGNSSPTTTAEKVTSSPTTTGGQAAGVLAAGRLSLLRGDAADLERGQIGLSADTDLSFGLETTPTLHAGASAFLAPVDTAPKKGDCFAALKGRHDSLELVSQIETKWTCVSTTEGNVAVLRIVSAPGVGSPKLVLSYTVWR
jgi:hypothetical protein